MKKTTVMTTFLLLVIFVAMVWAGSRGKGFGEERFGAMKDYMLSRLNLTSEQSEKIKGLRESMKGSLTPLRSTLIRKRMELKLLWMDDALEPEKIKAKQKEIREMRGQIGDRVTDFRLDIHQILTPEQRQELITAKHEMRQKRRSGMAGRRGPQRMGKPRW